MVPGWLWCLLGGLSAPGQTLRPGDWGLAARGQGGLLYPRPLSPKGDAAKDTPAHMVEGLFLIVRVDSKHLLIFVILLLFLKRW